MDHSLPSDGGPILNAGLVALWFISKSGPVLLENLYVFVIFQGGGTGPLSPLDPLHQHDLITVTELARM